MTVLNCLLLVLATAALAAAALRLVSRGVPDGLERMLATAVVAVATAGAEALMLGWLGLGMDAFVLAAAAGLTWGAALLALPAPEVTVLHELQRSWLGLSPRARMAAGALVGGSLAALAAWVLRPMLGYDTLFYHLPVAVAWVQEGNPGAVNGITPSEWVGAYPAFDELMLAWSAAIARSFAPFSVWPFVLLAVTAAGGWLGLRATGVPRPAAALAVGALVISQQIAGWQATGASTDPAALAWLVAAAGLGAASVGRSNRPPRPALLAPVLLAAALAVGTKPTVAPLTLVVVAGTTLAHRSDLRAVARPLGFALAAGALVGGWWYARNSALYGAPLWPFYATPWGTPVPEPLRATPTLLSHFDTTIGSLGARYLDVFGGSLLLIAAAVFMPLLDRSRIVLYASAATAIAVLAWMNTPNTGLPDAMASEVYSLGVLSTTRYLVGGVAVAALAVALVTRRPGARRWIAYAVLAIAAVVNVAQTFDLGQPAVPSPWLVLAGMALGALGAAALAGAAGRIPRPTVGHRAFAAIAVGATALIGGLGLAAATPRYLDRLAMSVPEGPVLSWFLEQPGFEDEGRPIATLPLRQSIFAGPHLEHPVDLANGASCAELRERARVGWVVIWGARAPTLSAELNRAALRCFDGLAPAYRDPVHDVFTERR